MKWYCALGLTILLAACGTPGPAPDDAFYRLPALTALAARPFGDKTVHVQPFDAASLYRDRAVVFSDGQGLELRRHHYQFWSDAPPDLVRLAIATAIRQSNPAATVLTGDRELGDYELDGRIDAFERRPDGGRSSVLVALTLTLRRGGQVVVSREYRESAVAGSERMVDSVTAFGAALQRVLERFAGDVVSAERAN